MELIEVLNAPEVSEKTKAEGLVFLRKSAAQNFTPALLSLCTCLRFSSQKKEESEIVSKIIKLAEDGDGRLFNFTGIIYYYGYADLDSDHERARYFWEKAASLEVPFAQMQLAKARTTPEQR
jgi:TPR repeat protein